MKHIQYRGDIAYFVRQEGGKRHWKRLGRRDDPMTWEAYKALEAAMINVEDATFRAVAVRFSAEMLRPDTPFRRSDRTKAEYTRQLRDGGNIMQAFGRSRVTTIKPKHISTYLRKHRSPISANREVSVISQVMQQAIAEGLIDVNPCTGVRRMPERRRSRYLTDEEFLAIREAAPASVQIAMDIAYLTGLRLSDVLSLRAEDARDGFLHAREGKTRQRVRFELTDTLSEAVGRSGLDIGPVVHTIPRRTKGDERKPPRHYTLTGFESVWRRAKLAAKLPDVRFHDIRAKHATDRDEEGLNAQLALGHTDGATTARYIRHALGRVIRPLK